MVESLRPSPSVVISDPPPCQYSVPLWVWTILGQVRLAEQRARLPSLLPVSGSVWVS